MTDAPSTPKANKAPGLAPGIKLEQILEALVDKFGWAELGKRIPVNCFLNDPSIKSSLKFLRTTPWARSKVEALYVEHIQN